MPRAFTESIVESAPLAWLEAVGWQVPPDIPAAERRDEGEAACLPAGRR
jgi:hypothetical protein